MNKLSKLIMVALFGFLFLLPTISHAAEKPIEEMTQGEFALWLIKAVGASDKLPPAATAENAIEFLTGLGVVPDGDAGWQKDETVTREMLAGLSCDPDFDSGNASFEALLKQASDCVKNVFDDKKLGIFGVNSASSSTPAV